MSVNKEQVVEFLKNMTAIDLANFVKELEEIFGVSAAAPAAAAAPVAAAEVVEEEQTEFDVVLTQAGGEKVKVIKVVREITGLGLKDAKALVDEAPKEVKTAVNKDEANKIKAQLEEVGAKVEIK